MIISTKKGTPKEELEKIVDKFENQGLDVTLITGKDYNVFGLRPISAPTACFTPQTRSSTAAA